MRPITAVEPQCERHGASRPVTLIPRTAMPAPTATGGLAPYRSQGYGVVMGLMGLMRPMGPIGLMRPITAVEQQWKPHGASRPVTPSHTFQYSHQPLPEGSRPTAPIRHSPFTIRHSPFAIHHSPFTIRQTRARASPAGSEGTEDRITEVRATESPEIESLRNNSENTNTLL
jgi:hypothetical protein